MEQSLERLEQRQIQIQEQLTKIQQDIRDQMLELQRNIIGQLGQLLIEGLEKRKSPVVNTKDDNEVIVYSSNFTPIGVQTQLDAHPREIPVTTKPQQHQATAVFSFMKWPLISSYRASGRTQSLKLEMIDSLFKPVSDKVDEGIVRKAFLDFYTSLGTRKPDQIIIFSDGVSKSQFNQVLDIELDQVIEACKFLDKS
ncbi:hypothetical protein GOBAR_AA04449 [Gossypium barbadense]|uniref:Piwi domain-containing protein n=1 Tax=Gossypium barbadense TaxID=3634 RepID=A0A2P5YKJ5_GOSBA|nr:hypothetical protein GOBAR_AA04449 [Gossypium barbadense]